MAHLVYVAGAYCGDVVNNIAKAEAASIALIRNGWHVITPHKNTSGYEQYEDGKICHDTWMKMDLNILKRCDILYVLDNWRGSAGTIQEIDFAKMAGIPTYYEEDTPADMFKQCEVIII